MCPRYRRDNSAGKLQMYFASYISKSKLSVGLQNPISSCTLDLFCGMSQSKPISAPPSAATCYAAYPVILHLLFMAGWRLLPLLPCPGLLLFLSLSRLPGHRQIIFQPSVSFMSPNSRSFCKLTKIYRVKERNAILKLIYLSFVTSMDLEMGHIILLFLCASQNDRPHDCIQSMNFLVTGFSRHMARGLRLYLVPLHGELLHGRLASSLHRRLASSPSCCLALDSSSSFPCPAFRAISKSVKDISVQSTSSSLDRGKYALAINPNLLLFLGLIGRNERRRLGGRGSNLSVLEASLRIGDYLSNDIETSYYENLAYSLGLLGWIQVEDAVFHMTTEAMKSRKHHGNEIVYQARTCG
ncbi:hypothetical protein STEG23_003966 [Scotinomys teguina]